MKDVISILYSLAASTHEEGRKEKPSFSGSSGLGSARRNCREQAICVRSIEGLQSRLRMFRHT